jgi:hypothetical protein
MSMQMVQRWHQQFQDGHTSVLDDARPHMAAATVNHIATFGWEHLDHVPYSPDLVPSDFYFFPTLKRTLKGLGFTTNEDAEATVRTQDTDFYQRVLEAREVVGQMPVGTMLKNSIPHTKN